ncbi:arabinan endo-1,5-alpha-L-arabinosidase [Alteromonadaceae bacterium 2753L.S.0a.02]|nr:arabinan endo-1,5-alpha-L-arabinosidase [Alteromonadaceae bacterium 2753L.S.0a.02]
MKNTLTAARCACSLVLISVLSSSCSQNISAAQVEVHDPVMIKSEDSYYLYSTGPGITFYSSKDMINWHLEGRVFTDQPSWAKRVAPGFNGHIWAPDIYQKNGLFYVFYSVSAFGKNTSGIGVAVNKTLDPSSPDYAWMDQGAILLSVPNRDQWNAIDPAIVEDESGTPWMAFGSFWEGLKLVKLDESLLRLAEPQEWHDLAMRVSSNSSEKRTPKNTAIEAPYIFKRNGYYYLFVSFDFCCRGKDSTYNVRVGRSRSVTGPYIDREGVSMLDGGGSLVISGNADWVALGHNAAYTFDNKDYLVLHAYETADNARQKLKILPIQWQDNWPQVDPKDLNNFTSHLVNRK